MGIDRDFDALRDPVVWADEDTPFTGDEVKALLDALKPFAEAARAHGVRKPSKDDLWVSLGVASSAWARAAEVIK